MTIKDLVREAHKNAKNKGFYDEEDEILLSIKDDKKRERIKKAFIVEKLALITSETSESVEALRHNNHQKLFQFWHKDTFEDELADQFIRLADLCGRLEINIEYYIKKKMEFNATRERLHGKEF